MTGQGKNAIDLVLAESFKELGAVKPIDKITIKEITDKAGVIRPTFYNHFQDKYELMEWIVQGELIDPMMKLIMSGMVKEGVSMALKTMHESKAFYRNAIRLEGQNSFREVLQQALQRVFMAILDGIDVHDKLPYRWLTLERLTDVYAESVSYVVTEWIRDDMNVPEEELIDSVMYVLNHSSVGMLEELRR